VAQPVSALSPPRSWHATIRGVELDERGVHLPNREPVLFEQLLRAWRRSMSIDECCDGGQLASFTNAHST
jgi:hypothetical protein